MAADEEHVGECVTARVFEIDHDDVGVVGLDRLDEPLRRADPHEIGETGLGAGPRR